MTTSLGTAPSAALTLPADRQLASYRQLVEVAHLLLVHGSLGEVLSRVADALERLIAVDAQTIYVADPERRVLQPLLSRDAWAEAVMSEPIPFGRGLVGWVAEHGQPVLLTEAESETDTRAYQVPGTPVDAEAMIVLPLVARGELCGVFAIYRLDGRDFSRDEFALTQVFADQAALALDSARAHDALEASARTDSVTGLGNHRLFHEQLRSEVNRGHRYRHPVSLVLLDLDDFKAVNDRYGHLQGDAVLHRLGAVLQAELRDHDRACRIGGEEFALVLPHTTRDGALELAERIRHVVESTSFERAGHLTVSAGVAALPADAQDPTSLIEAADAALYGSKAHGKNRVTVYRAGVRRERDGRGRPAARGLAELSLLETLAHRLAVRGDPRELADVMAVELRTAIDYHHCRVFLLDEDGEWLEPVAGSGEPFREGRRRPDLRIRVGEGITGAAVAAGRSVVVDDAMRHPAARHIDGTPDVEESLLVVPMRYDQRTLGAILLSKLGLAQFTTRDRRLVEILAGQAALAFDNAALERTRRRLGGRADALLRLAADPGGERTRRRRLGLLRRALDADWLALCEHVPGGERSTIVDASGARPSVTRSLRGVTLPLRTDGRRVGRLATTEAAGLPAAARTEHVLRVELGPSSLLLAGADSGEAERELRVGLRELGDRLAALVGVAVDSAAPPPREAPARSAPARRRVTRLAADLPSGLPRRRLLAMLAEHAVRLTGADGVALCDYDQPTNVLRMALSVGAPLPGSEHLAVSAHLAVAGETVREGRPTVVDDYRRHPLAQKLFLDAGVRSVVTVPVMAAGQVFGTLQAFSVNRPLRFAGSQLAVLEVVAQQAAALIAQDQLYRELESSYRATVEALTNALEVKDAYTSAHVRQIAELALELGREFRLGSRRLRDLEYAAILHDIGKIGVPGRILSKPGPLSAEERAVVERHTEIGHGLLRDIPFLARVAEIVRACHERWDGAGYPDGLAGERIPLEARIIFVCDTWDAMRSDRPYRRALDRETARERLRLAAGTQLDPRGVEAFMRSAATLA